MNHPNPTKIKQQCQDLKKQADKKAQQILSPEFNHRSPQQQQQIIQDRKILEQYRQYLIRSTNTDP